MRSALRLTLSIACLAMGCSNDDEPPRYGSWKELGPLPEEVRSRSCAVALDDSRLFIMGGLDGLPFGSANTASGFTRSTWFYDPTNDTWTPGPPMSQPHGASSCTRFADGRVAIFGDGYARGVNSFGGVGPGAQVMEIFDPRTATWSTEGHTLKTPVGRLVAVLADGRIVMAGGTTEDPQGMRGGSTDVEMFDPAFGTWTDLPPLPHERASGCAVFALPGNRVLIAIGKVADILDVDARTWMPGPPPPESVFGGGAITRDSRLAVACTEFHAIAFDTSAMEWKKFGELSKSFRIVPRCGGGVVAIADGRLLTIDLDPMIISADASFVRAGQVFSSSMESSPLPRVALADGRAIVFGMPPGDANRDASPSQLGHGVVGIFTP